MKLIGTIALLLFILSACASVVADNQPPKMVYSDIDFQGEGALSGVITEGENNEGLPFAKVKLMSGDDFIMGTTTDIEGAFQMDHIAPGQYDVLIEYVGYMPLRFENLIIKPGQMLEIEGVIDGDGNQIIELKPIIYIYPEEKIEVEVALHYDGEVTHTYPKTETSSWKVSASPDGTLTDSNGRNYYGLFWEGKPNQPIQPNCGAVVEKDSLIPFLETSLDQLGLNFREANEFIVFWLPILEQSPYNLIYFANEDYTDHAELVIEPKPDTVIRVMMGYVPLQTPISIPPQILSESPIREGFTVVEWGGTKCALPSL